jgi:hypothetical protein
VKANDLADVVHSSFTSPYCRQALSEMGNLVPKGTVVMVLGIAYVTRSDQGYPKISAAPVIFR